MADIKDIQSSFKYAINPIHSVPLGDDVPNEINMLVEIPKGSFNKYEYHNDTGLLKLDRVLYEQLPYPIEYGAIPQTWDEDNDPLDVMCLVSFPTFPGCLISVRPIALMVFEDTGEVDDKILAVPTDDIRFKKYQDLSDITDHQKDELEFFWTHVKELQFKYKGQTDAKTIVKEWQNKEEAYKTIEKCHKAFKAKYSE